MKSDGINNHKTVNVPETNLMKLNSIDCRCAKVRQNIPISGSPELKKTNNSPNVQHGLLGTIDAKSLSV